VVHPVGTPLRVTTISAADHDVVTQIAINKSIDEDRSRQARLCCVTINSNVKNRTFVALALPSARRLIIASKIFAVKVEFWTGENVNMLLKMAPFFNPPSI